MLFRSAGLGGASVAAYNRAMATRVVMSVEEYLRTSFDGPDREYLDGEIVERNMGEYGHGGVQAEVVFLLRLIAETVRIRVRAETRVQISQTRYRVPDVSVWRAGEVTTPIPAVPPFLVIEILSREDRMVRMIPKIQEYLSIGVQYVWVIDPEESRAVLFTPNDPGGQLIDVLQIPEPAIELRLDSVLKGRD